MSPLWRDEIGIYVAPHRLALTRLARGVRPKSVGTATWSNELVGDTHWSAALRAVDSLLATMPREAWEGVIASNLSSVFHGCQAVLPAMISQRGGRIVNIASLSALLAPAGQTNYAAAKAGDIALRKPRT